jgi:hypothetical protein
MALRSRSQGAETLELALLLCVALLLNELPVHLLRVRASLRIRGEAGDRLGPKLSA